MPPPPEQPTARPNTFDLRVTLSPDGTAAVAFAAGAPSDPELAGLLYGTAAVAVANATAEMEESFRRNAGEAAAAGFNAAIEEVFYDPGHEEQGTTRITRREL